MNIEPFEETKLRIEEARNPKIYPDDSIVEGLFNRTEILIIRIEELEAKQTYKKIFNEIKSRTRIQNNNQKLIALDTLYDTIIGTATINTLREDFIKSAYQANQSKKQSRIKPALTLVGKWIAGSLTTLLMAYIIYRLGWN